jgi:hypothetical protein
MAIGYKETVMITDIEIIKAKREELKESLKKPFLSDYEEGAITGRIDALDWILEDTSIM